MSSPRKRPRFKIGPGALVTAAFIGPGTITTCTQAGASFGYALLWGMVFTGGNYAVKKHIHEILGNFIIASVKQ